MTITAAMVKELREKTGAGMMDCKTALNETAGDMEAAVDWLRAKGIAKADKKAGRTAAEGLVGIASDGPSAVVVEVNSETDFVARNDEFVAFAQKIADLALAERPADRDALLALDMDGRTVEQSLTDMTGKIGEKIDVRRVAVIEADGGEVVAYVHPGAKLGVMTEMRGSGDLQATGRDVAMQAAAMNPIAATRDDVPEDVKAKELEIGREQALNEGKPEHIIDKIATGKLERYYKDNVLVEQPFVKDSSMTVKKMLENAGASLARYVRFALGD